MSYTLVLRQGGSAELVDERGDTRWESDSDDDFKDEVSDEFLTEDDVEPILDYLVESEILSDDQAYDCVIEEESLADGPDREEPDDEYED